MPKRFSISGDIISNDCQDLYDWVGWDGTSPKKVRKCLDDCMGEDVVIDINSPGGEIGAGSEIYTMLKDYSGNITVNIVGAAHSAASVIAMGASDGCLNMSPTALMMVHCVSTRASGNHNDMEKTAETLRIADEAMSAAYQNRTGKSKEEILDMMEKETWLNAEKAKELGLIDKIMFENSENENVLVNSSRMIDRAKVEEIMKLMQNSIDDKNNETDKNNLLNSRLKLLRLKGEM